MLAATAPYFDFTAGSFYHSRLNWRSFASASTTLFGSLEVYGEGVVSYNLNHTSTVEEPEALTFGANAGFLLGLWDQRIQFSGEYYYTTEYIDLTVKGNDYPLIRGHNIASGIAYYSKNRKVRLYSQVQYNVSENSGLFIPVATFDAFPFVTISAATPVVFGDSDGTYIAENPSENEDRAVSVIIAILLRASF